MAVEFQAGGVPPSNAVADTAASATLETVAAVTSSNISNMTGHTGDTTLHKAKLTYDPTEESGSRATIADRFNELRADHLELRRAYAADTAALRDTVNATLAELRALKESLRASGALRT